MGALLDKYLRRSGSGPDRLQALGIDPKALTPNRAAPPLLTAGMFGGRLYKFGGPEGIMPIPPTNDTKTCIGLARGLEGNARLYGKIGALGVVQPNTAAIIPSQFGGASKAELRPFASNIAGRLISQDGTRSSWFNSITDIVGGKSPIPGIPVRDALQRRFPGQMIVEIPGGQDVGPNASIVLNRYPSNLACPTGTRIR